MLDGQEIGGDELTGHGVNAEVVEPGISCQGFYVDVLAGQGIGADKLVV